MHVDRIEERQVKARLPRENEHVSTISSDLNKLLGTGRITSVFIVAPAKAGAQRLQHVEA